MVLFFPQCWDGSNLDSPDHKSHMSYPVNGACPFTHPKAIPEISYQVIYPVPAANATTTWRLASDKYDESLPGGRSAHGDYDMAWQKDIIDAAVRNCVQARKDCHARRAHPVLSEATAQSFTSSRICQLVVERKPVRELSRNVSASKLLPVK